MKYKRPVLLTHGDERIDLPKRLKKPTGAAGALVGGDPMETLKQLTKHPRDPGGRGGKEGRADGIKRNKGVDERSICDVVLESITVPADSKVTASLKAKALLYDQVTSGSSSSGTAAAEVLARAQNCLIDVVRCRKQTQALQHEESDTFLSSTDLVEIVDEFGRTRSVPRHSRLHRDFLLQNDLKRGCKVGQQGRQAKIEKTSESGDWAWSRGSIEQEDDDEKTSGDRLFSSLVSSATERQIAELGRGAGRVQMPYEAALEASSRAYIEAVHEETERARLKAREERQR